MERFYYQEELFFPEKRKNNLMEMNEQKVIEMLTENTAVGVVGGFYEENFPIYFISSFALRNINYTFEEFMEKTDGNYLEVVCPEDKAFFVKGLGHGSQDVREYRLVSKEGEYVWINEVRTESVADNGRRLWISSIRLVHNEHLARKKFISTISHDVRTPLNEIIGAAKLAEQNADSPAKVKQYLEMIMQSGYHLMGEIDEALEIQTIENGVVQLKNEPFCFRELMKKVEVEMLPTLKKKNQNINIDYGEMGDYELLGDVANLKKIFVSLISNASRYSENDTCIAVEFENNKVYDSGKIDFDIRVIDFGIGIEESLIPRIFEPFERIDDSREESMPSIGLGLAITRGIIQVMGGNIDVDSKVGVGSCFTVNLELEFANEGGEYISDADLLSGMRILLAEDGTVNQQIIAEMLKVRNVTVDCADNGKEVVDKFRSKPKEYYDLILMDIHMPILNGYEATEKIRECVESGGDKIPIIAVTADATTEDIDIALSYKMNGHMSKPIDFDEMFSVLAYWKRKSKSED